MLCFVLLIAYFVIPVYRADAASGTSSPLDAQTLIATLGQTLPGQYCTSNNPDLWSSTSFEYYGTYDWNSVVNSNSISDYYKNLNCAIILYRADVSGLANMLPSDLYNLQVEIGTAFENLSFFRCMCGISFGRSGYDYQSNTHSRVNYSLSNTPQVANAQAQSGYFKNLQFVLDYVNTPINIYLPIIELQYGDTATALSLVSSQGVCANTSLVENKYAFFYIVCPVVNDDVVIQGSGGSSGDTADIYDYLSNTLHDMMESNAGLLQSIYNFIVTIPDAILDGLHDLFIPSQQDLEDFKDDIDELLHDTFGALYDAETMIHDSLSNISAGSVSTMHFPGISVAGFTLAAQEVPIKPAGMEVLFDTLAVAIDIICTFAFVNMLKNKLHKIFDKDNGGD